MWAAKKKKRAMGRTRPAACLTCLRRTVKENTHGAHLISSTQENRPTRRQRRWIWRLISRNIRRHATFARRRMEVNEQTEIAAGRCYVFHFHSNLGNDDTPHRWRAIEIKNRFSLNLTDRFTATRAPSAHRV